jgi:L-threonylcarbamoyladenylate synthase
VTQVVSLSLSQGKTRVMRLEDPDAIPLAAEALRQGRLVAFPTDTVYGVGASAFLPSAVEQLYLAKERPRSMAIPLLLASATDIAIVAEDVPKLATLLMRRFWPGGLTLVLFRSARVPDVVTAGGKTVAVRLPDHAAPRALAAGLGAPLAATSANLSGHRSPVTARDVLNDLDGRIDLLLDGGPCPGGVESTILDLTGPEPTFLREGAISRHQIEDFRRGLIGSSHAANLLRAG